MNREGIIMTIKGCSVHVEEEIKRPREHRDLRGTSYSGSPCLPETGALLSEGRGTGNSIVFPDCAVDWSHFIHEQRE
jgi:hypothetical protein